MGATGPGSSGLPGLLPGPRFRDPWGPKKGPKKGDQRKGTIFIDGPSIIIIDGPSMNSLMDVHQWISMDFQFFEIQFFEKTMKNNEKPWKAYEQSRKTRKYSTGCLPKTNPEPLGPRGVPSTWGPKERPQRRAQRKGTKERGPKKGDHIHWWTINDNHWWKSIDIH